MAHKTIYRNPQWQGAYCHAQTFKVDTETGRHTDPYVGYHHIRVMLIQMALEEFPDHPIVKAWRDGAFGLREKEHALQSATLLNQIAIPWVAGFVVAGEHYHQPCFKEMSDNASREGKERPRWITLAPEWPVNKRCAHCDFVTVDRTLEPFFGELDCVLRCSVEEAQRLHDMLSVGHELTIRLAVAINTARRAAQEQTAK